MDDGFTGPLDQANGTRTKLMRDDWDYVGPIPLEDFKARDFALLDLQRKDYYAERQADDVLRIMAAMEDDPSFGYQINNFRHCLQSATLAHRAGKSEDYVAMAFLHDIGFDIAPSTHGAFAAALMAPYISPDLEWMLIHHAIFQNVHCPGYPTIDQYERERWRGHPAFEMTAEFVAMFDQDAMDPNYENMPMSTFEPMVRRLFANPPRKIDLAWAADELDPPHRLWEPAGYLRELWDRVKGPGGNIDNAMKAHSLRPHTMEGHSALYKPVLPHTGNTLPTWFIDTVGVYTSLLNGCD